MAYIYSGSITSVLNGVAAFAGLASSYFSQVSRSSTLVDTGFLRRTLSNCNLDLFLKIHGSIGFSVNHFASLDENTRKILEFLLDYGLIEILQLNKATRELSHELGFRLELYEAEVLAQAVQTRRDSVFLDSEKARMMAIKLGIAPLSYENFIVEAYKRGLIDSVGFHDALR